MCGMVYQRVTNSRKIKVDRLVSCHACLTVVSTMYTRFQISRGAHMEEVSIALVCLSILKRNIQKELKGAEYASGDYVGKCKHKFISDRKIQPLISFRRIRKFLKP